MRQAQTRRPLGPGVGTAPFLGQTESDGEHNRTDEDADEAECQHAPEHTEEYEQERQLAFAADEIWLQEVVDDEDDGDAVEEQSDAPPDISLHEEPDGGRKERQARTQ